MICNVGKIDRIVRGLLAIVLIGAALYFIPTVIPKVLLLAVAVSLLMSAWYGVCYVYRFFGISTAHEKQY
jgi:uncharacterized membrane protein YccC